MRYNFIASLMFVIGFVLLFTDSNNSIVLVVAKLLGYSLFWIGGWLLGKTKKA